MTRVTFELVSWPLAPPWSGYSTSAARFKLYQDYLERSHAASAYQFLQLSDVADVAFQADPFAWVAREPPGLHVFSEVPGRTFGQEPSMAALEVCYGGQVFQRLFPLDFLPSGFVIGTSPEVERYVQGMTRELLVRSSCSGTEGLEQAVHNAVARSIASGLAAEAVHVRSGLRSALWTGGPQATVKLDPGSFVLNEDSVQYSVLHKYKEHEELWRALNQRFLHAAQKEQQQQAPADCAPFDVQSGDLRGYDLDHLPVDTQQECCAACSRDTSCGSFVFSDSRRHCWLKTVGGERRDAQGDDVVCGLRQSGASGGMPSAPGQV